MKQQFTRKPLSAFSLHKLLTIQSFLNAELSLFNVKYFSPVKNLPLNVTARSKTCLQCVAPRGGRDDEWQGLTEMYLVFKRAVQLRAEEPQL